MDIGYLVLRSEWGFNGMNALQYACSVGNIGDARIILKRKLLNVNERDGWGNTALHIAIERGAGKDIINLLLNAGADLKIKNLDGHTPFELAESINNREAIYRISKFKEENKNLSR